MRSSRLVSSETPVPVSSRETEKNLIGESSQSVWLYEKTIRNLSRLVKALGLSQLVFRSTRLIVETCFHSAQHLQYAVSRLRTPITERRIPRTVDRKKPSVRNCQFCKWPARPDGKDDLNEEWRTESPKVELPWQIG
jgi:hypothetical protein